jgi:Arm DNA-binding domain
VAQRTTGRLTALKVERAHDRGMYADGGGLYLRVTPDGTKNWVYRYMLDGRPRWMGAWTTCAVRPSGSPREGAGSAEAAS